MNTHWPEKSLTMWKINHGNDFVRLAKMPENNCSQKVLIRNLWGPIRHESWQKKVQNGLSDSDEIKNQCV